MSRVDFEVAEGKRERYIALLEKVAEAARSLKTTSYMRLEQGGRFLIDEHDWYAFCEARKSLDEATP